MPRQVSRVVVVAVVIVMAAVGGWLGFSDLRASCAFRAAQRVEESSDNIERAMQAYSDFLKAFPGGR